MREIKFRAWSLDRKKMYECVSIAAMREKNRWITQIVSEDGYINAIEGNYGLMQYVGLKDKNGREIYEGDIVKGKYWEYGNERRFIGRVEYVGTSFEIVGVKQYYGMTQDLNMLYEVIGNIHENKKVAGEE